MKYLMLFLLLLIGVGLFSSGIGIGIGALRDCTQPECPYTGHATCSDGIDNDCDNTKDEAASGTSFASCTGGYCLEVENAPGASPWSTVANTLASGGNIARSSSLADDLYTISQKALCFQSLAANTYYLSFLFPNGLPSPVNQFIWVDTSPLTLRGILSNTLGAKISVKSNAEWGIVRTKSSEDITDLTNVTPRGFSLSGSGCIFVAAIGVDFDCAYLSTDINANPICPGGSGAGGIVDYEILRKATEPTVCTDFANANVLAIRGFDNSDNTVDLRALWVDGTPDRFCYCADILDTYLNATITTNDTSGIFSDDSVEVFLKDDQTTTLDTETSKVTVNIAATQAHFDTNYPSSVANNAYTANVTKTKTLTGTLNDGANDTGYKIFACYDLPATAQDQIGKCDIKFNDKDATLTKTIAFNPADNFNDFPNSGGLCKFSATLSLPSPDTIPTAVTNCVVSGVTESAATIQCDVSETSVCKVRYDEDNDNAVSGADSKCPDATNPNCDSFNSSGGKCTKTLTNLLVGTPHEAIMDATDLANNTGSSAIVDFSTLALNTFYLAPNGNDANAGTSGAPWQTWTKVRTELNAANAPGKTIIAKNGTWTQLASCTGLPAPCLASAALPSFTCGTNAKNGTATQPITIKAENERQAFLQGDGSSAVFKLTNCNYWTIEGIRAKNADLSTVGVVYGDSNVFVFSTVTNIIAKRLLAENPNRCANTHGIVFNKTSLNSLVEESEVYFYHRHGMTAHTSNNIKFRRVYTNPRDGHPSPCYTSGGGTSVSEYRSNNGIIENSIGEDSAFLNEAGGSDNKYLGNISFLSAAGTTSVQLRYDESSRGTTMARRNLWENNVGLNADLACFDTHGAQDGTYKNFTCINTGRGIWIRNVLDQSGTNPNANWNGENILSISNTIRGFYISTEMGGGWQIDYPNAANNGVNYDPADFTCPDCFTNATQTTPTNFYSKATGQGCIVYIPSNSNMKGAGKNGADIGANVIFRYQDGILTSIKLWHQTTGAFPCGAQITGVNDDATFPTSACVNVHKRLNVGVNGCAIP